MDTDPLKDPLTQLSHKLIRTACRDDFDPFMIGNQGKEPVLIRACFYYAVVMTDKHTVVFDNFGRGGMCDMVPEEMVACWKTPELLASQGVDFAQLQEGQGDLRATAPPKPGEIVNDLPGQDEPKHMGALDEAPFGLDFAKRVSLKDILLSDKDLFGFLLEREAQAQPQAPTAHPKPRP